MKAMKRVFCIALTLALCLTLLASCSAAPEKEQAAAENTTNAVRDTTEMPPATEIPAEPMVYHADLTHDGKDEKIVVDLSQLQTEGVTNATVSVFDSEETLLWSGDANISHAGNNGIYLYQENEYAYLLTWCPWVGQGFAGLNYEIFALSTGGEVLSYRKGEGQFTLEDEWKASLNGRQAEANLFIRDVNRFLEKSTLLVATTPDGAYFSTPDNPVKRLGQEF